MSKNVFDIGQELMSNAYPGRGIILGRTPDNKKNVIAYFIMGRSENSRNRVFTETEDGIRTEAFDPWRSCRRQRCTLRHRRRKPGVSEY